MPPVSPLLTVMVGAARKAGRSLARDFGEVENLQVSKKGPSDFVTAADRKAEDILFTELNRVRPGYGFLMEERGAVEGSDKTHRWIVDPLDGTLNFLHGMPHYAISIGLERDGEMVAGVVYDLSRAEIFSAERGRGAFLNDRRLRVAGRTKIEESVIATGIPYHGKAGHEAFLKELAAISNKVAGVRRFGSAALDMAWVAAGRFDAFWERGLQPWDIAAGIVLVREAGGFVRGLDGGDPIQGDLLAGNAALTPVFADLLTKAKKA
ncbi:MAG: inositol monophosphatase family protein [Caulobacterales bacterium]